MQILQNIQSFLFISLRVPFSVKTSNTPSPYLPCLVYYRELRHLPQGVPIEGGGAVLLRCAMDSDETAYADLWFQCYCLLAFTGFGGLRGWFSAGELRIFGASSRWIAFG